MKSRFGTSAALLLVTLLWGHPAFAARLEVRVHAHVVKPSPVRRATRFGKAQAPAKFKGIRAVKAATVPRVTYVASRSAFLGMGSAEGLQLGMELPLRRRGLALGTCKVSQVADHTAACEASRLPRAGDTFVAPARPKTPPAPAPLPPAPGPAQLARSHAALASATFEPVDFQAQAHGGPSRFHADINLSESFWTQTNRSDSTFHAQTLDVALREAELGGGFTASVDLTVMNWAVRPTGFRFPESARTQLFVRQLEVAFRTPTNSLAFAAGRVVPWHAPGVGVLDGVQAGWHNGANVLELGVLAGSLPDPILTLPTVHRPLAGVYLSATQSSLEGSVWSQEEAVVTAQEVVAPQAAVGQGWHVAADVLGLLSMGRTLDGAAEIRVGAGVVSSPFYVEAVRVDLNLRPSEKLQLFGDARYQDNVLVEVLDPGVSSLADRSVHTTFAVAYELSPFSVALTGGFDRDLVTGLARGFGGPELGIPHLFGTLGGAAIGYEEYRGWTSGRDGYVQGNFGTGARFRLSTRLSYFLTGGNVPSGTGNQSGVSALIQGDVHLTRALTLRSGVMSQVGLHPFTNSTALPVGLLATTTLNGRF